MNRYEAKYHAVTQVAKLIDDFVKETHAAHPYLNTAAKKIMRVVIVIQKQTQGRADRLSRDFEKFELTDALRK